MESNQKVVFVTGSSRGIGKAIALGFAKAGYAVVINASKSAEELEQTKQEIEQLGVPVLALLGDVSEYDTCAEMFMRIQETFGAVDVLVNNAGVSHIGLFTDMHAKEWRRLLAINVESVFNCTHLAVPNMVRNRAGSIINISSIWGQCGASCEAVYSASKGAIDSFTKAMAKELGPSLVRVNGIACGVVETKMNACFDAEEKAELIEGIPLMRFGSVKEVADLAVFLASENASYLTGQIITLDGGMI